MQENYKDEFEGIDEVIFSKNEEMTKEDDFKKVMEKIGKKKEVKTKTITLRMTEVEYAVFKAKAKYLNKSMSRFFVEAGEQVKAPGFSEIKKEVEDIYENN